MKQVKEKAKQFITNHKIKKTTLTSAYLTEVIDKLGFSVVEFSDVFNDDSTKILLEKLKMNNYIKGKQSFYYTDGTIKIIFLKENLSEKDKITLLLHEIGHIHCDKLVDTIIDDTDTVKENYANKFMFYVLEKDKNKVMFLSTAIILSLAIAIGFNYLQSKTISSNSIVSNTQIVYTTKSGEKYHLRNCRYVKNRTDESLHKMQDDEAREKGYEPCKVCINKK